MTTTLTDAARADARAQEAAVQQYQHYHAYLTARRTLLDAAQRVTTAPAFEAQDEDRSAAEAQARIAALPAAQVKLFAGIVEAERQDYQRQATDGTGGRLPDPDATLRAVLTRLIAEAEGQHDADGRGIFPQGTAEEVTWYAIDRNLLTAAPTEAAYTTGLDPRQKQKLLVQVGGAVGVMVLALGWIFWPKAPPTAQAAPLPLVNGTQTAPWRIAAVGLGADGLTLPVLPSDTTDWPDAAQAYQAIRSVPPAICLPEAQMATRTDSLTVTGLDATAPVRRYQPTSGTTGDLRVQPCEGGAATWYLLTDTTAPTDADMGAAVAVGADRTVTVEAVQVVGPGTDPLLPPDQAEVLLTVQASAPLTWGDVRPLLTLLDGQTVTPSAVEAGADGRTTLRYLVPLPLAPRDALWTLQPDATAAPGRWRIRLDPPPTRDAVLRDALLVTAVQARPGDAPGTLLVAVQVTNTGALPLALTVDDVTLRTSERVVAQADQSTIRDPLAANETRTLTLRGPFSGAGRLTLTVGVARFAIEP